MHGEIVFWAALALAFVGVVSLGMPRRTQRLGLGQSLLAAGPGAVPFLPSSQQDEAFDVILEAGFRHKPLARRNNAALRHLFERRSPQQPSAELSQEEWQDLLQLAERDPKAALARIDRLPASERENPLVRFVRIYALGQLIWPREVGDVTTVFRGMSREQVRYAEQGVGEIAALERDVPTFFDDEDFMHAANRVCGPFEYHRAGGVQRALGWTKVVYWLFSEGRFLSLDENDPDTDELRSLPGSVLIRMLNTRFRCRRIVMSSVLMAAKRTQGGWIAGLILGARAGSASGKVADLDPIGVLTLRENGTWHLDEKQGTASSLADAPDALAFAAVGAREEFSAGDLRRIESLLEQILRKFDSGFGPDIGRAVQQMNDNMARAVSELRDISRKLG